MRIRHVVLAAIAALYAPQARAILGIDLAQIVAYEGDTGWHLEVSLEGTDVTDASFVAPGGSPTPLACEAMADGIECSFEDPERPLAGFATLELLLAAHPAGTWTLAVNAGTLVASLPFAPAAPNGLPAIASPPNGAANVSPTPTVEFTHGCSNCNGFIAEIEHELGGVNLEVTSLGPAPPTPASVPYASFESIDGPKPPELPPGRYRLGVALLLGSITTATDQSGFDEFDYATGAARERWTTFTVPEPGAAGSGVAALGALLACALRRAGVGAILRPARSRGGSMHAATVAMRHAPLSIARIAR